VRRIVDTAVIVIDAAQAPWPPTNSPPASKSLAVKSHLADTAVVQILGSRLPFLIFAVAATFAITFVGFSLDLGAGTWQAIAVGGFVGNVFAFERRFMRWWDMRRLRRELARRPIAHRIDA
jgi:hypothetical protein